MSEMAKEIKGAIAGNLWFYIFGAIAVGLLCASWFVPPMGVIDGSVIASVGEIFAFAALGTVIKAIDKGMGAKVSHGQTSLAVGNACNDEDDTQEDQPAEQPEA